MNKQEKTASPPVQTAQDRQGCPACAQDTTQTCCTNEEDREETCCTKGEGSGEACRTNEKGSSGEGCCIKEDKSGETCCTKEEGSKATYRTDEEKKALCNRLNRMEGQIRGLKGMLEKDAYCTDILTQSAAVTAAMNAFNKELLASHVRGCVARDIRAGKEEVIDELVSLLQKLMK